MKLIQLFLGRLPDRKSILGVYAVIVALIYSWTLFTSFYKLPSWMFYLTVGQILSVYAYAFLVDFLESFLVLAGVLIIDFTFFLGFRSKEEFQSRSILVVLVALISSMMRLMLFQGYDDIQAFLSGELIWWMVTVLVGLVLAVLASKNKWVRSVLDGMADRVVIFLYIYLPLSLISLIIVIVRNIY